MFCGHWQLRTITCTPKQPAGHVYFGMELGVAFSSFRIGCSEWANIHSRPPDSSTTRPSIAKTGLHPKWHELNFYSEHKKNTNTRATLLLLPHVRLFYANSVPPTINYVAAISVATIVPDGPKCGEMTIMDAPQRQVDSLFCLDGHRADNFHTVTFNGVRAEGMSYSDTGTCPVIIICI